MNVEQLRAQLPNAALSFRGYNVINLGRTPELLEHPDYGPIVEKHLREASLVASEATGGTIDLVARVRTRTETTLDTYADAIALVVASELAQLEILQACFGIDYRGGRLCMGYSLGELTAIIAGGVFAMEEALTVPLVLAADCAELAQDVTLGVLFSRGRTLPATEVQRLCMLVNMAGRGIIGISAILSPNSLLLLGQYDTLDRFVLAMQDVLPGASLRRNMNYWPPLHTPIVWQRHISDRAALLMQSMAGGFSAPQPPVLSLVTGKLSYDRLNARELLQQWTYRTQRLWDAVYETLALGIQTIVHVGPQPNIVPATYQRLKDNVEMQIREQIGMRALSAAMRRPWIKSLLPQRTALLRAPHVEHIVLEDWLLDESLRQ